MRSGKYKVKCTSCDKEFIGSIKEVLGMWAYHRIITNHALFQVWRQVPPEEPQWEEVR